MKVKTVFLQSIGFLILSLGLLGCQLDASAQTPGSNQPAGQVYNYSPVTGSNAWVSGQPLPGLTFDSGTGYYTDGKGNYFAAYAASTCEGCSTSTVVRPPAVATVPKAPTPKPAPPIVAVPRVQPPRVGPSAPASQPQPPAQEYLYEEQAPGASQSVSQNVTVNVHQAQAQTQVVYLERVNPPEPEAVQPQAQYASAESEPAYSPAPTDTQPTTTYVYPRTRVILPSTEYVQPSPPVYYTRPPRFYAPPVYPPPPRYAIPGCHHYPGQRCERCDRGGLHLRFRFGGR